MNLKTLLSAAFSLTAFVATAQNSNKAFAITGDGNKDFMWMNIRQVDLGTGQFSKTIFQRSKTSFVLTDVDSKKTTTQETPNDNVYMSKDYPTGSLVAA